MKPYLKSGKTSQDLNDEDSAVNASGKENKFQDQTSPIGILHTELAGTKYKTNTPSFNTNSPNSNHNVLGPAVSAAINGWY